MKFLHPAGASLGYYLQSRAAGVVVGTMTLFALGISSVGVMVYRRRLIPGAIIVAICAILHAFFVFVAFGPPDEHVIYDPLIAAGVITGTATLPIGRTRMPLLMIFVLLGVLGQLQDLRTRVWMWRHEVQVANPAPLYATPEWNDEWSRVVDAAAAHRLLLLSYGTGMHHYFPGVESPKVWFLEVGQVLPVDHARLMLQLEAADVVVVDLTGPTAFIDHDLPIQATLSAMCLTDTMRDFRIWMRKPPEGTVCHERCRQGQRAISVLDPTALDLKSDLPHSPSRASGTVRAGWIHG